MFEKLLHKHVYSYLEHHKLLIPNNSGFWKKHSTLTSLLSTCHSLYQAYDSNLSSRIVFLDKSKAFDRVDHICLIFKLQQLGIDGSLLNLLSSCIFRRSQVVLLGRSRSDLKYTNCGVPQGSVLGPLSFFIYVNDIATNIKASISLFADVTTLLHSDKCTVHLHSVLTQDLCTLHRWSELWNVTFNPQKTAVMTISKYRNDHPPLLFNNTHLSETDRHKHLGSLFHHILSWHTHIVNLHHKVMTKINRLRSFGNLVPRHVLLTIYKTNILPVFDYGNIIYDNCCDYGNRMLDKAQLSAAKIIVGCLKLHPLTMY